SVLRACGVWFRGRLLARCSRKPAATTPRGEDMGFRCSVSITALLLTMTAAAIASAQTPPPAKAVIQKPTPNSPKEPLAEKLSLAKSAEFLDGVALSWTQEKKCGTCHTNYAYLMARP